VSSAALIAPSGGEKLPAGLPFTVSWNATSIASGGRLKNSPVELSYSLDNGVGFPNVFASGLPNSGSYSWPVPMITSSAVRLRIAVTDTFGHVGFDTSNTSFTIDSTKPVSSILSPIHKSYVNSLPSITGSASDGGSGIAGVQLVIKDIGGNVFWDGSSWSAAQTWLPASGGQAWSFVGSSLVLTHGQSLFIVSRAVDSAGNAQATYSSDTIFIDKHAPASTVVFPADGSMVSSLASITGSAVDTGAGVASVLVSLKNMTSGFSWNGSAWVSTQAWIPATGAGTWTVSAPALITGNSYLALSRALDRANNAETQGTGATFTYYGGQGDTTAPVCAIATRGHFGIATWPGAISGTASDNASGVRSPWPP
jgi:hypothetical protein